MSARRPVGWRAVNHDPVVESVVHGNLRRTDGGGSTAARPGRQREKTYNPWSKKADLTGCQKIPADDASVVRLGSMDLGTDYCYAGAPLDLYWSLARGFLGCYIYVMNCLLSAGCFLIEGGKESFVHAGDNARQVKRGQLLLVVTPQRGSGDPIKPSQTQYDVVALAPIQHTTQHMLV